MLCYSATIRATIRLIKHPSSGREWYLLTDFDVHTEEDEDHDKDIEVEDDEDDKKTNKMKNAWTPYNKNKIFQDLN